MKNFTKVICMVTTLILGISALNGCVTNQSKPNEGGGYEGGGYEDGGNGGHGGHSH